MVNARTDIVATGLTLGGLLAKGYAILAQYQGHAAVLSTWLGFLMLVFALIAWLRRGIRWLTSWRRGKANPRP